MPVDKDKIRALAERIRQNGKVDVNRFVDGGDIDELEPAVITASPETRRGRYKMYKKSYKAAKKELKNIRKDINKFRKENGFIKSDVEARPFIDRMDALPNTSKLRHDTEKARDEWYSNLWDEPNNIISQLYRYYSRHHGVQRKNKYSRDFSYGPGADIIDLGENVIRLTPDSKQSTALFNEFVEREYPTVLPASEYKENPERILGDNARFPASNISIYGGIRDGAFVLDSLKNFSNETTVIPARNIKSGTPRVSKIIFPEKYENGNPSDYSSYDWDKIRTNHHLYRNSLDSAENNFIEHYSEPSVQEGIVRAMQAKSDENKDLRSKIDNGNAGKYDRDVIKQNNADMRKYQRMLNGKLPLNKYTLNRLVTEPEVLRSLPKVDVDINLNKYMPKERNSSLAYSYMDENGDVHPISDWNAAILDGKTILANPDGGVFIGKIRDISRSQKDSLNNYLEKNPSWIYRADLGSFDQYRLDEPSLQTYLRQYFEHPRADDPNVYTIGTTEPNKLWSKANGGFLRRYDDGGPEKVVSVPAQRDNTATAFNPSRAYVTDTQVARAAKTVANKDIMLDDNPMGFAPVVGDALQAGQVIMDALDGKYGRAALSAALLAVPNIIEKPAKSVIKAIATAIRKSPGSRVTEEVYKALGRAVNTDGTGELLSDTVIKGLDEKYRIIKKSLEDAGVDMSHITDDDLWRLERGRRMDLQDYVDDGNKINVAHPYPDHRGYFEIIGFSDTYPTGYIRLGGKGGGQVPDVPGAHVDYVANLTDKKFRGLISEDDIEKLADRGLELGPDEYVEHGVQQRMTDAAIRFTKESDNGLNGVISGEVLLTPEATSKMYDKYPGRVRVGDNGRWHYSSGDVKEGPIYLLTSPTSTEVPTKMFNYVEGFPYMYDPMRLKDGHYQILGDDVFKTNGGLLRKYENGGPEGDPYGVTLMNLDPAGYMKEYWAPPVDDRKKSLEKYALPAPNVPPFVNKDGTITGLKDITGSVRNGSRYLYDVTPDMLVKFYRDKDSRIYMVSPGTNVNVGNWDEIPYKELRRMLPKRKTIGADRLSAAKMIPGFIDKIADRAAAYGINPNLLLHRIMREGFIDQSINGYNSISASDQDSYWADRWNREYSGFESFGLDDAGANMLSGKYELLDPSVEWYQEDGRNEKGRAVKTVHGDLKAMIEIKAAEMAYRQRELAKRGITGDAYTNAAYNGGLNWSRLGDADYITSNYSVPDYGVFGKGGKIHIKESKKGTFTAAAKKRGKSVQAFASQVLANKGNYSPAMVKKANFARNAAKWHSDGGAINKALDNGDIDVIRAAINNVLARKMSGK